MAVNPALMPQGVAGALMGPQNQLPQIPEEPFVWGKGGRRMSPQDIAREREIAAYMMQGDYSPIQSPWQGLARVAENVTGAFKDRSARRAGDANAAESDAVVQALLQGGGDDNAIIAALTNPNISPEARSFAEMEYKRRNPANAEPVIKQTNVGDYVAMNPMTGEEVWRMDDPNPKPQIQWIRATDPSTGEISLVPMGPQGPMGGNVLGEELPEGWSIDAPSTPPRPQMDANGVPRMLTPEQYRGAVEELGQEATDYWMLKHNIQLGGG